MAVDHVVTKTNNKDRSCVHRMFIIRGFIAVAITTVITFFQVLISCTIKVHCLGLPAMNFSIIIKNIAIPARMNFFIMLAELTAFIKSR